MTKGSGFRYVGRSGGEPVDELAHYYRCGRCGQAVDKRDLGAVFHHEAATHKPIPDDDGRLASILARMMVH